LTVLFTDESTDGTSTITTWLWNFGDGNTSNQPSPTHTYVDPGTYTVSLTVTNSVGSDTDSDVIVVWEGVDTDGDGLPDSREAELGTDPNLWDTDGDSFSDGHEVFTGRDPLEPQSSVADSTVVVEAEPGLELLSIHDDVLTFRYTGAKKDLISRGTILISTATSVPVEKDGVLEEAVGFLRQAVEVVQEAGTIIVQTAEVALSTAYPNFDEHWRFELTFNTNDPQLPGAPLLNNLTLYQQGGLTISITQGQIVFAPTIELRTLIQDGNVEEVMSRLEGSLFINLDLEVSVEAGYQLSTGDIPLVTIPIPIASLPLVVELSLAAALDVVVEGSATLTAGFDSTTNITIGGRYVCTKSGDFFDLSSLDIGQNCHEPTLTFEAGLGVTLSLKPKVDLSLYGQAGAYLQAKPYVDFHATYPCPPVPDLGVGIDGEVGLYVDFFGLIGLNPKIEVPGPYYTIWTGDCGPELPTADFGVAPRSGELPLSVDFTDLSEPGTSAISSWSWNFGDGGTSSQQHPSHTYNTAGTYTVSLRVTTAVGYDEETKTNYITVKQGPTADFSGTPRSGEAPLSVQFTDLSTAGSWPITSWSWDFGDGGTSTQRNPSHTYNSTGAYTVSLSVVTSVGSDTETKTDYIRGGPGADFSGTPRNGQAPLSVQFTDLSELGTSSITSWSWNFGDGGTSTQRNPSHTYNTAGTYTVSLNITTAVGPDTETKTNYITVEGGPTAHFSGTPRYGQTPLTVQFTDLSEPGTSPITSWSWNFGDGGASSQLDPIHTYNTAGIYTVSLRVTTSVDSDTETKPNYIDAKEPAGLHSGFVTPEDGYPSTKFTYYVTFQNPEGIGPTGHIVSLWLDEGSEPIDMARVVPGSEDWVNGVQYKRHLQGLAVGPHSFHFSCAVGGVTHNVRWPPTGEQEGPPVDPPIVLDISIEPQETYDVGDTPYFDVTVRNPSGDLVELDYWWFWRTSDALLLYAKQMQGDNGYRDTGRFEFHDYNQQLPQGYQTYCFVAEAYGFPLATECIDLLSGDPPHEPTRIRSIDVKPQSFNPDSETVALQYDLSVPSNVVVRIYDLDSNLLRTLVGPNEPRAAGVSTETWDGRDSNGSIVPQGQYQFRIVATKDISQYGDDALHSSIELAPNGLDFPEVAQAMDLIYDPFRDLVIVVDSHNAAVKRYTASGSHDGNFTLCVSSAYPTAIVQDSDGCFYVLDNAAVIWRYDSNYTCQGQLASLGDGTNADACAIAYDGHSALYAADNRLERLFRIDLDGSIAPPVSIPANSDVTGIAVDKYGRVWTAFSNLGGGVSEKLHCHGQDLSFISEISHGIPGPWVDLHIKSGSLIYVRSTYQLRVYDIENESWLPIDKGITPDGNVENGIHADESGFTFVSADPATPDNRDHNVVRYSDRISTDAQIATVEVTMSST